MEEDFDVVGLGFAGFAFGLVFAFGFGFGFESDCVDADGIGGGGDGGCGDVTTVGIGDVVVICDDDDERVVSVTASPKPGHHLLLGAGVKNVEVTVIVSDASSHPEPGENIFKELLMCLISAPRLKRQKNPSPTRKIMIGIDHFKKRYTFEIVSET